MKDPDSSSNNPNRLSHAWRERTSSHPGKLDPILNIFIFALSIILILSFGIWITPRALSQIYQIRGGQLLVKAMHSNDDIPCSLNPLTSHTERESLESALLVLQKAKRYNRMDSQTYLLSGRVYCLLGQPEDAFQAYEFYTNFRPKNNLGRLEYLIARLNFCITSDETGINRSVPLCDNSELRSIALIAQDSGIDLNDFLQVAEQAFKKHQFNDAYKWFAWSQMIGLQLEKKAKFQQIISEMVINQHTPNPINFENLSVEPVTEKALIQAENLLWIDEYPGDPLRFHPGPDPTVGILWWRGCALAVVDIKTAGVYQITLRAQHSNPPPVQIHLQVNFTFLKEFILELGDESWQELQTNTSLKRGLQFLSVCFSNDEVVDGNDRNAVLDWLQITLQP